MQATLPTGMLIKRRYLVLDLLSKSNSGAVYLVEDQHVKNKNYALFALKEVINPSKHKLKQIAVEGMSLRLLHHQALPKVYTVMSVGEQQRVYIPLDYIEGPNLEILRLRQPEKRFSLPNRRQVKPGSPKASKRREVLGRSERPAMERPAAWRIASLMRRRACVNDKRPQKPCASTTV